MPDPPRILQLARNLALIVSSAARYVGEDPVLFAVQGARRVPHALRAPVVRVIGWGTESSPRIRGAFARFLADDRVQAAEILATAPLPRTALARRLGAELAVNVGRPDAAPGGMETAHAVTRARAAWRIGDMEAAIAAASESRAGRPYRERLEAECTILRPGYRLAAPASTRRPSPSSPPNGHRALHLLINSLPHTRSGYAMRSHSVLQAQHSAGIAAEAVTRIGYPVTVGLPLAAATEVVEGVVYHRILPAHLPRTVESRMHRTLPAVMAVAEEFRPTVIHATTHYRNALVAEVVARALGIPWVYEVRGQLERTWVASLPAAERDAAAASRRFSLLRAKETEMMLAADHVVTLSESLLADIVQRGVPRERVSLVPNAVDDSALAFQLDSAEARTRVGLPRDGFWVGTVSSLVDYEGLDTLLDAVALLRRRGEDIRVALVGDGVSRPSLVAQAARLGLGDAAVLPGRVDREMAPVWHRALDVFVVPRRDLEVCRVVTPLKPIEAMAAGRPVVASDLPALAEIVHEPGTGVVTPAGDVTALAAAIASLRSNPSERLAYGERGRAFAMTRTWAANGALYRRIYERLEAT